MLQAAWRIPGQYLVVLQSGTHQTHVQRTIRRLQAKAVRRGYLLEVLHTFSGAFNGFLVKMSSDVLHLVIPHLCSLTAGSGCRSRPVDLDVEPCVCVCVCVRR